MLVETLRIENVDGSDYLTINRDDYDPSVHTLWHDRLDEPETAIVLEDGLTIENIERMTWAEAKAYCIENGFGEKSAHETWGQFLIKSLGLE